MGAVFAQNSCFASRPSGILKLVNNKETICVFLLLFIYEVDLSKSPLCLIYFRFCVNQMEVNKPDGPISQLWSVVHL